VVGEGDEVIAGVAVGGGDALRLPVAVGAVRAAVQVAVPEAPVAVAQKIVRHAEHAYPTRRVA